MKQTVLYDEGYEYQVKLDQSEFNIHFDYGTRYHQINMQFSHFHPYYEIYFLLNGQSQHFVEGKSYNLDTHDLVLLKPYRLHRTNYSEHQPCKRLILQFSMSFFDELLPDAAEAIDALFSIDEPVYRFSQSENARIISLFNQMYKASKQHIPTSNLLITGLFIQLLDSIYRSRKSNEYLNHDQAALTITGNPMENKVYEITSYIHQNFNESLTLENLASRFFVSPHYLSRQFKSITGFSLIQYIQETRIKRAQEYLLDTDLKIIEIIDICGFGSISQFNRVFSNLVGSSPSVFRKHSRL